MDVNTFHRIYEKSVFENEQKSAFLEKYVKELDALDFKVYSEKLTVPVLVPIGSRILFRGELKHTNEVTVALGADYFAKCSVQQAEILKQRRIKESKMKLKLLKTERDHLNSYLKFSKLTLNGDVGIDILEVESEEEHKAWRETHEENMRQYKQRKVINEVQMNEISNKELWNRLEELELQEELKNELVMDDDDDEKLSPERPSTSAEVNNDKDSDDDEVVDDVNIKNQHADDENNDENIANEIYLANYGNNMKIFHQPSKLDLFELVVDRHNALKEMIAYMKSRYKNGDSLLERLDDNEKFEELEDEIGILEDMLVSDDDDDTDDTEEEEDVDNQLKKSVAFADEDDSETFELTFKHSEVEPSTEDYDPQIGITKPSDVIKAYSKCSNGEKTSILKKPKDGESPVASRLIFNIAENQEEEEEEEDIQGSSSNNILVVKDVVEKDGTSDHKVNHNERPMSLFKKKRQQSKE